MTTRKRPAPVRTKGGGGMPPTIVVDGKIYEIPKALQDMSDERVANFIRAWRPVDDA